MKGALGGQSWMVVRIAIKHRYVRVILQLQMLNTLTLELISCKTIHM